MRVNVDDGDSFILLEWLGRDVSYIKKRDQECE